MTSILNDTQIVTWLLVIGGWFVINHQHNKRETRKELRSLLDKIYSELIELEKKSFTFHTTDYDETVSSDILRSINRIAFRIFTTNLLEKNSNSKVIELRRAITLKNFDKSNHKILNVSDPILQDIVSSQDDLLQMLEARFSSKHQKF